MSPKVLHRGLTTAQPLNTVDPHYDFVYNEIKIQMSLQLEEERLRTEQLRLNYALL